MRATVMCEMSPPSSAASLRVDQCVEQVEAEWQKPIDQGSDTCGVSWLVVFWRWPPSRIAPMGGDDAPQWKVATPPTRAVCAPPEAGWKGRRREGNQRKEGKGGGGGVGASLWYGLISGIVALACLC